MPKKESKSGTEAVIDFITSTDHPLKKEIEAIRKIILGAEKSLEEHIKWSAPSFYINGEDKITYDLRSPKMVRLIFHRGAKVKKMPKTRLIDDPENLLQWATNDRAIAAFTDMDSITNSKKKLTSLIKKWIAAAA